MKQINYNTKHLHYAVDMQAYRIGCETDTCCGECETACNWGDERAVNYEVSVYVVKCGVNDEGDAADAAWDSRETVAHLEVNDEDTANEVSSLFSTLYPDAITVDNDGIYD